MGLVADEGGSPEVDLAPALLRLDKTAEVWIPVTRKFPEVNEEPSIRSVVLRSPSLNPSPPSTTSTSEERRLRGSSICSGVDTIVIAAKNNYLNQWQVVN